MFTVYVLQSNKDGQLYIGMTGNLKRRLRQHDSGQQRSTRLHLPYRLIYTEEVTTRAEARERERYLKSGIGREFVKNLPGWRNWQTQRT